MCRRKRCYTEEDIQLIIDDQFDILKEYRKKYELVINGEYSKESQKCVDRYLRKLEDVSLNLIRIAEISKELEEIVINELNRRIEVNKKNTSNRRVVWVLEVLLHNVKAKINL